MAELKEKLFSEFAPVSTEEWMAKITADLKGVPFEKKLVWKTGEGFNVNPFYRAEDIEGLKTTESLPGEFPYVRGTKVNNDWKVRQEIKVTDFKAANEKALDILDKGVTSLGFFMKGGDVNAENIATLLNATNAGSWYGTIKKCITKGRFVIGPNAQLVTLKCNSEGLHRFYNGVDIYGTVTLADGTYHLFNENTYGATIHDGGVLNVGSGYGIYGHREQIVTCLSGGTGPFIIMASVLRGFPGC